MKYYIGLDVSMQKTFICIFDKTGKVLHEDSVKTDPKVIADHLADMKIENYLIVF